MENYTKTTLLLLMLLLSFFVVMPTTAQKRVKASYYAHKFHGRLTASGTKFNMYEMTCAHKKYPFGTLLKVRNPNNGKEVVVEVTDRGPFIRGRSIDLSYAAAKSIGMIPYGVMTVEYQVIDKRPSEEEVERVCVDVVPLEEVESAKLLFQIPISIVQRIQNIELTPLLLPITHYSVSSEGVEDKKKCKNIVDLFLHFW